MCRHQTAGYLVWKSKHIGTLSLFVTPPPPSCLISKAMSFEIDYALFKRLPSAGEGYREGGKSILLHISVMFLPPPPLGIASYPRPNGHFVLSQDLLTLWSQCGNHCHANLSWCSILEKQRAVNCWLISKSV